MVKISQKAENRNVLASVCVEPKVLRKVILKEYTNSDAGCNSRKAGKVEFKFG